MFLQSQKPAEKKEYINFLMIAGALSKLFSDSNVPYLYYRLAENVFCKAFNANNLSRSDCSVDARKEGLGIGLKTFLAGNYKTFQKVAEFNNDRNLYKDLGPTQLIKKIAELRNIRIEFTENIHNLDRSIYHCVVREPGNFLLFEESMDKVDIEKIKNIKKNKSTISFDDGKNDYSFLLSKSTLTKRFVTKPIIQKFEVEILEDPFVELEKVFSKENLFFEEKNRIKQTIFLPLYGSGQTVHERSGLNQWNAKGRERHPNEVYIPISAEVNHNFPNFFPDRDTPFMLKLPNGNDMKSKICQDGDKALMSYSNKELGQWILRDILKLKEGELLTDDKLQILGIDSVRIDKINESQFDINFSETGSYERFRANFD